MTERPGYGDAEAKRIIQRAAEIDAEGRPLDAPALREIAAEAGISPLAVDRALAEHAAKALAPAPWHKRHRALITITVIGMVMLLLAFLRRLTPSP